jgi:Bacterial Ig-like domain
MNKTQNNSKDVNPVASELGVMTPAKFTNKKNVTAKSISDKKSLKKYLESTPLEETNANTDNEIIQLAQVKLENSNSDMLVTSTSESNPAVIATPDVFDAVAALPESGSSAWTNFTSAAGTSGANSLLTALGGLAAAAAAGAAGSGAKSASIAAKNLTPLSLTAALDPASDTATAADKITNQVNPTLKGQTAPGAKVTVDIDTNADGVTDVSLSTIADATGTWSITPTVALPEGQIAVTIRAVDSNGISSPPETINLVIDTSITAPTANLALASDTGNAGDRTTSSHTPLISGGGATPGDLIKVTLDTNSDGIIDMTLNTVANAAGNWSVLPTSSIADGLVLATITASDTAGNESTPSSLTISIDSQAPSAPNVMIAAATDGLINEAEALAGVPIVLNLPSNAVVGDSLRVLISLADGTNQSITMALSLTDVSNHSVTMTLPTNLPEGPTSVSSQLVDQAGNVGLMSVPASFAYDRLPTTLTNLSLLEGSELNLVENRDGIQVAITVPTDARTGEVIALAVTRPDGTTFVVEYTVALGDVGSNIIVTLPLQAQQGGPYQITSSYTDAVGNVTAGPSTNFSLDTNAPSGSPALSLGAASDGYINAAELAASNGVFGTVALPAGTQIGDTVALQVTLPDGTVSVINSTVSSFGSPATMNVLIPSTLLTLQGSYTVSALVIDAAGNSSATASTSNFVLDTILPGESAPGIAIDDSTPAISVLEGTAINANENSDGIQTQVTLPQGAVSGDFLNITATRPDGTTFTVVHRLSPSDLSSSSVLVTLPSQTIQSNAFSDQQYTLTASLTDAAGNTSASATPASFTLDTRTPTGSPVVSITAAAGNGIVSADEVSVSTGVLLKASIPAGTDAGDVMHLAVTLPNGTVQTLSHIVTAIEISTGSASVLLPETALVSDGVFEVVVSGVVDASGNQSSPSIPEFFTLDRTAPGTNTAISLPEGAVINTTANSNGINVTIALPAGSQPGDTLTVQITRPDGTVFEVVSLLNVGDIVNGSAQVTMPPQNLQSAAFGNLPYEVSATVTDAAGNSSTTATPQSFILDTTAPIASVLSSSELANSVLTASEKADGVQLNANLSSQVRTGDLLTFTITGPNGPQEYTTVAVTDGPSIQPISLAANFFNVNGSYNITMTATDVYGNVGPSTNVLSFSLDATIAFAPELLVSEAANGYLNANQIASDGGVTATVTLEPSSIAGDIVHVALTNPDGSVAQFNYVVTANDLTSRQVSVLMNSDTLNGNGTYTVNATLENAANVISPTSASTVFTIDLTTPTAPSITLLEGTSINAGENANGISINVSVPVNSAAGDVISLSVIRPDSSNFVITHTLSAAEAANPTLEILLPPQNIQSGGVYSVIATMTDLVGNVSAPSTPETFTLDTISASGIPMLSMTDAIDGTVNNSEAVSGSPVQVTLPTGTQVGDTVSVTLTTPSGIVVLPNVIVSAVDLNNGFATVVAPSVNLSVDGNYSIQAFVSDEAGNSSLSSAILGFSLDRTALGGLAATIAEGAIINAIENADGIQAVVTLDIGTVAGDIITLNVNRPDGTSFTVTKPITTADIAANSAVVTIPAQTVLSDANYSVTATIADAAGNVSAPINLTFTLDASVALEAPTVTLPEAAGNGLINAIEVASSGGTSASVSLPIGTTAGDVVTLTLATPTGPFVITQVISAVDLVNGFVAVLVPSSALTNDGPHQVTAQITDSAGNASPRSSPAPFTIDTHGLGNPTISLLEGAVENRVENADGIQTSVAIPLDAVVGNVLSLAITQPDGSVIAMQRVLSANEITTHSAIITIPTQTQQGSYSVTPTIHDAAGNASSGPPVIFFVDTIAPSTPAFAIFEAADGFINATEVLSGNGSLAVAVPVGAVVGDILTLSLSRPGGTITINHPMSAQDITSGQVEFAIPSGYLSPDGSYSASVALTDTAGNTSLPSSAINFIVDTQGPPSPSITIVEGQIITVAENADGIQTSLTLYPGVSVGDTLTLNIVRPDGTSFVLSTVVSNVDLATGTIAMTLPPQNQQGSYSLTPAISDIAGNVTTGSPQTFNLESSIPVSPNQLPPSAASVTVLEGPIVNALENADGIQTSVPIPASANVGDLLTLALMRPDGTSTTITHVVAPGEAGAQLALTLPFQSLQGTYSVTPVITNANGASTSGTPVNFTLDSQATSAPSLIIAAALDGMINLAEITAGSGLRSAVALPSNAVAGDTLTLVVTQPSGTSVTYTKVLTASDIGANETVFTIAPSALASTGNYSAVASITDIAGNLGSPTATLNFALNITATPTPTQPRLDVASDSTGPTGSANDSVTTITQPTLIGSGAEPLATVTIYDGSVAIGTVIADLIGHWAMTPSVPLTEGVHSFTTTQTDTFGNVSLPSAALSVTVDITAPVAATPDLIAGNDSGVSDIDNVTNASSQTFNIAGNNGHQVALFADLNSDGIFNAGDVALGSATVVGGVAAISSSLGNGIYSLRAIETDLAGNTSTPSAALNITIDRAAPSISEVTLDLIAADDSGISNSDNRTNNTAYAVSATGLEPGGVAQLTEGGNVLATAVADITGAAVFNVTGQANGAHNYSVSQTDFAGNRSTSAVLLTVNVDSVLPAAATPDLSSLSDSGSSNTDNITANAFPTFNGPTVEPFATVTLLDGTIEIGTTTADASGNWSITSASAFAQGTHSIHMSVTDMSGNTASSVVSLQMQVMSEVAIPATPDLAITSDTGISGIDNVTKNVTPTFISNGVNGNTVSIFADLNNDGVLNAGDLILGNAIVNAGSATITTSSALPEGLYNVRAIQTDLAGNVSAASSTLPVRIDTTAPVTNFATLDLITGDDTGTSSSDNATNKTAYTINAEGLEPGATARLMEGTVVVASSVVGIGGTATFAVASAASGTHAYSVAQTDAAGNTSTTTSLLSVKVDNTAPTLTSTAPVDNATTVNSTGTITLNYSEPIIAGTGNQTISLYNFTTGALVETFNVTTGLGSNGGALSISGSSVTVNTGTPMSFGTHYDVQMQSGAVNDGAGNGNSAITTNSAFDFTIATPAATVTVANLASTTYSQYLHTVNPNLVNTNALGFVPGTTGFGAARFTGVDDTSSYESLAPAFASGLNFFGTVYNQIGIGSNGFITFGHLNNSYSAVGIPGYTAGGMIAAQFDDWYSRRHTIVSTPGGNSTGTDNTYFAAYQNAGNGVVTLTFDDVGYFAARSPGITDGLTTNNYGMGNAEQIRLVGTNNGDIVIQLVYESVNWINGNTGFPTAGWTAGNGVTYGAVTGNVVGASSGGISGTVNFLDVESTSNVGINGVYEWVIGSNGLVGAGNVPMLNTHGTDTVQLVAQLNATGGSATYSQDMSHWDSRFTLVGNQVKSNVGATFEPTETSVELWVTVTDTTSTLTYQKVVTVSLFDQIGAAGNDQIAIHDSSDIAKLTSAVATQVVMNGNAGEDTIILTSSGLNIDLTAVQNSALINVERVDLGTGNSMKLGLADVFAMSSANQFNSSKGWVGLPANVTMEQLVVDGNASDTLTVVNTGAFANQWNTSVAGTVTNGGHTYDVYNSVALTGQLLVDHNVNLVFG